jgi:hypothetical protein
MRGDGRIFRRNRIWWVAYCQSGKEYRESSHSADEHEARNLLQKRLASDANATISLNDVFERPDIVEMLSEREARALYSAGLKTLRRLRKKLSH